MTEAFEACCACAPAACSREDARELAGAFPLDALVAAVCATAADTHVPRSALTSLDEFGKFPVSRYSNLRREVSQRTLESPSSCGESSTLSIVYA